MNMEYWFYIIIALIVFFIIELIFRSIVFSVNKKFQWLITNKDEFPVLSKTGLKKFISHGFDKELGWNRKANTSHEEIGKNNQITNWTINSKTARANTDFDQLDSKISCYGDSFTFCRQVNDNETWEHFLSKSLGTNVQNFGVGNHGIDQSLLRLKRNFLLHKTDIVILSVVPDTISRIVSVWKHYYEYGNTFGFKPRFVLKNNKLKLIQNPIDDESKFYRYHDFLDEIRNNDFFYRKKFRKEKISFPYSVTVLKNARRNLSIIYWIYKINNLKKQNKDISNISWNPNKIIMDINLKWRLELFEDNNIRKLFRKIIEEYVSYSKINGFTPVFAFLPQKDDLLFIKTKNNYYETFLKELSGIDGLHVIDLTNYLVKIDDLDPLFSDDNSYGGHYSKEGNKLIADKIHEELKKMKIMG